MSTQELEKIRKELVSFSKSKDFKAKIKPYQKKAYELSQMEDEALEKWYISNGKQSFTGIVFNDITNKQEETKYKKLCNKVNFGEDLTEKEIEFAEEYEATHGIEENSII